MNDNSYVINACELQVKKHVGRESLYPMTIFLLHWLYNTEWETVWCLAQRPLKFEGGIVNNKIHQITNIDKLKCFENNIINYVTK
jgi:hypothetical protein